MSEIESFEKLVERVNAEERARKEREAKARAVIDAKQQEELDKQQTQVRRVEVRDRAADFMRQEARVAASVLLGAGHRPGVSIWRAKQGWRHAHVPVRNSEESMWKLWHDDYWETREGHEDGYSGYRPTFRVHVNEGMALGDDGGLYPFFGFRDQLLTVGEATTGHLLGQYTYLHDEFDVATIVNENRSRRALAMLMHAQGLVLPAPPNPSQS